MTENHLLVLDGGRLRVARALAPLLRENGLETLDRMMALSGGTMMRSVPGRSTVRIELKLPSGGTQVTFLKRYEPAYLTPTRRLLRLLHWPGAKDEALNEWEAIHALRAAGFSTAEPIAVGQNQSFGVVLRSFLLTAEIAGGIAAHDYARSLEARPRRELALQVAELTRRFHGAGFVHKDCYLSHLFVVERGSGRELFFIDLQRVARPRGFRRRWVIKDLAQLAYSAQLSGATSRDLLAFTRAYFGRDKLTPADRRRLTSVLRRVQTLHRRGPKYDVIWDQPGVHPPNV